MIAFDCFLMADCWLVLQSGFGFDREECETRNRALRWEVELLRQASRYLPELMQEFSEPFSDNSYSYSCCSSTYSPELVMTISTQAERPRPRHHIWAVKKLNFHGWNEYGGRSFRDEVIFRATNDSPERIGADRASVDVLFKQAIHSLS
ncbi:hypothetical protein EMIT0P258_50027 [Pseudomonas sp. IT-P258]